MRACSLPDRRNSLSVRNGVLLCEPLIPAVMDHACAIWGPVARSHARKLRTVQSKCLRISANASWCAGNRKIREDLGITLLTDHIRGRTENFDLKLADYEEPFFSGNWKAQRVVSNYSAILAFSVLSSGVRQMPGYNSKGHCPPSSVMMAFRQHNSHQVAEAISQSHPNTSGYNCHSAVETKSFSQRASFLIE